MPHHASTSPARPILLIPAVGSCIASAQCTFFHIPPGLSQSHVPSFSSTGVICCLHVDPKAPSTPIRAAHVGPSRTLVVRHLQCLRGGEYYFDSWCKRTEVPSALAGGFEIVTTARWFPLRRGLSPWEWLMGSRLMSLLLMVCSVHHALGRRKQRGHKSKPEWQYKYSNQDR